MTSFAVAGDDGTAVVVFTIAVAAATGSVAPPDGLRTDAVEPAAAHVPAA